MRRGVAAMSVLVVFGLAGCTLPGAGRSPDGIWDPYEERNRKVHDANKRSDRGLVRNLSVGYAETVPDGVQVSVSNFVDTTSLPRTVANQILQGRLGDATRNTLRFAINATLGFAGLADVASDLGLPRDESGFGETLYVWGVPEGAYLELPIIGPSTERDAFGGVVDLVTDPMRTILSPETGRWVTVAKVSDRLSSRGRFANTVDSVLYESADSYTQARLLYLQNRRFELGADGAVAGDEIDLTIDTEGF